MHRARWPSKKSHQVSPATIFFYLNVQENFEQAVPYFTHAIEIYEVHLGRSDPTVETAIKNKELALSKLQSETDQGDLT